MYIQVVLFLSRQRIPHAASRMHYDSGDLAAYAAAGIIDNPSSSKGGSDDDDDSDDDFDSLLEPSGGNSGLGLLPSGNSVQVLYPHADRELVRLQSEHAISMMELRHERDITELRQDAREQLRKLKTELRRRDKALETIQDERDSLAAQLAAVSAELAPYPAQLAAARRSDAKHKQQLAAVRVQAAHERASLEQSLQALHERLEPRLEEASSRATEAERTVAELRKELEAANLQRADLQRSVAESRERLDVAWRERSEASTARDLQAERVTMLQHEVARLEDTARQATATAQARADEVRETVGALAAAREQRNQIAREAEACRVAESEAREELAAGLELQAAGEARVGAAERRTVQEAMARERAEEQLNEQAKGRAADHCQRQRRMVRLLLRATKTQLALGYARWIAGVAAVDALEARHRASAAAKATTAAQSEQLQWQSACDTRDVVIYRSRAVNAAWRSGVDEAHALVSASAAFARWALAACAHARCAARWAGLVQRAERAPGVLASSSRRPTWRLLLRQRMERICAHPAHWHRLRRCHMDHAQRRSNARICHTIFTVWRLSTQIGVLRERCSLVEARHAPVHVGPECWWDAAR